MSNKTYVGYTNKPKTRIRQHNGLIKGGAKYTTRHNQNSWRYLAVIASPDFTKNTALSFEWYVKHNSQGVDGRIEKLMKTMTINSKFNNYTFYMFVSLLFQHKIQTTPHITRLFDELLVSNSICLFDSDLDVFLDDVDND